jgi:hypothetical protein
MGAMQQRRSKSFILKPFSPSVSVVEHYTDVEVALGIVTRCMTLAKQQLI